MNEENQHLHAIEDRNKLIKTLEEAGFAIHGVITPNDFVWNVISPSEALKLYHWCFVERIYTGKLYGADFEEFLSKSENIFNIADTPVDSTAT